MVTTNCDQRSRLKMNLTVLEQLLHEREDFRRPLRASRLAKDSLCQNLHMVMEKYNHFVPSQILWGLITAGPHDRFGKLKDRRVSVIEALKKDLRENAPLMTGQPKDQPLVQVHQHS